MIAVICSIVSIDFIPFLICCEVSSRLCHDVTVHKYLWPHSRSTVVRSYRSRAVKAAWPLTMESRVGRSYCDHSTSCERRQQSALRSKSRSTVIWKFQNSALRLKRLVRPYGDLYDDGPRSHRDRSATAARPYSDERSNAIWSKNWSQYKVAVRSQPWCDWGRTNASPRLCVSEIEWWQVKTWANT